MDELALDIFRTDDFRATTVTEMVNEIEQVPGELEARGIFQRKPLRTETVTMYRKDGTLELVPTTERGTPEPLPTRYARSAVQIETPRLAMRDRINAREAQFMLAPVLPAAVRLDNANQLVVERQGDLVDRINFTKEAHRFACVSAGKILDADGVSVVADFYELFNIPQPVMIPLNLAGTAVGDLRFKIEDLIVRPMRQALKGRRTQGTRINAMVGNEFWRRLLGHEEVRQTYLNTAEARELRNGTLDGRFEFAGVTWENWDGSDFEELEIAADEARFYPTGARDMFFEYLSPGEDWEDIGALGRELYSVVSPDNRINMNEYADVYVRSYPLYAVKAPQALLRARSGAV